jgi:hypothetical protein
MPQHQSIRAFHPLSPAMEEMATVCANDSDYEVSRRADANETLLVANALQTVTLDALRVEYPGVLFRQLASQQPGLTPGTASFTWDEYDVAGMAKLIANYGDDLPDVAAFVTQNVGIVRSFGASFRYSKQDVRAVMEARRLGRQGVVLDVDRVTLAREIMERKKDEIAAIGSVLGKLPGILKNPNVTVLTAGAPAVGTSKKWTGPDKTGLEIVTDLRSLTSQIRIQSKGIHTPTTVVMPIEEYEAASRKSLVINNMETTALGHFLTTETQSGRAIQVLQWNRAAKADAAGTGPRVMAYEASAEAVRVVEPLDFEADPPQRVGLDFRVPCESRFGGVYIRRPLAFAYLDFI